ncbi:MAG: hypothetical protein NVS4B3_17080 [Gemmatimonadaceae bacterium]
MPQLRRLFRRFARPAPPPAAVAVPDSWREVNGATQAQIIAALDDGVAVIGSDGTIRACNPAAERILGIRAADVVGRHMLALPWRTVREDESPLPREEHPVLVALRSGQPQRNVVVGVRRGDSSSRVWVSVNATPVFELGQSTRSAVVASFRDVTEGLSTARALRESESRFRALFTRNGAVQLLIDAEDGCIVHTNPAADTFYGYGASGLLGRSISEINSASPAELRTMIDSILGGEQMILRRRHRLASGEERDVEVLTGPVVVSGRTLIHSIIYDVTDRVRAERSQARLAAVLDETPDLVTILEPDAGVVYMNRACRRLLALPADSPIPADAVVRLLPVWAREEIYERGIPGALVDGAWSGDAAIVTPEGREIAVSQVVLAKRGPSGEVEYLATVMRDISERKAAAEEVAAFAERLRQQSEMLAVQNEELTHQADELAERTDELLEAQQFQHAVLEHVAEGIVACDEQGNLTLFNRASREFHGVPSDSLSPELWAEHYQLFRADGTTPLAPDEIPLSRALCGEDVRGAEIVVAPRNGPPRTVEVSGRAFADAAGRKRGAVVAMHDVTERKVIDRMKNEFIGMVSHELRTPLTSIRGSLGLLEVGAVGPLSEKVQELVRIARQNSDRLVRLIGDILDVEKMEAGKMELAMQQLAPASLIAVALEGVQGMATELQVRVVQQRSSTAAVRGDRDRLLQVLTNLLSNAIKFSPARSTVLARAEERSPPGGRLVVRFSVEDRGPGVDLADVPRLFQKFQQLGTDGSRRHGGTGLGLAISRALVEQHGGRIGVDPAKQGGSVFWFELPVAH